MHQKIPTEMEVAPCYKLLVQAKSGTGWSGLIDTLRLLRLQCEGCTKDAVNAAYKTMIHHMIYYGNVAVSLLS